MESGLMWCGCQSATALIVSFGCYISSMLSIMSSSEEPCRGERTSVLISIVCYCKRTRSSLLWKARFILVFVCYGERALLSLV